MAYAKASVGRVELDLGQGEELCRLGPIGFGNRLPAGCPDNSQHRQENGERRCYRDPTPAFPPSGVSGHRGGKLLLDVRETSRIALTPQRKLPIRPSRPQVVVGSLVLVPGLGRLSELISELGRIGVLRLPSDEAGPIGEERLVDDLDAPRRCLVVFVDLVRGEQSRIDQLTKHLLGRFASANR